MNHFIEIYAGWLADYYLLTTILLTLALISAALLKQPAQRLMVTKSTLAALVLLAVLCAVPGWSLVHLLAAERPQTPAESQREESMEVADSPARPSLLQSNAVRQPQQPATAPPTAVEVVAKPNKPKITWPALLATSHLAGMACIVAWLALGWFASVRLRRTAQAAPANVCAILDDLEILDNPGSKRLRIFTHNHIDVAVALGVRRPMILLPERWTNSQSHDRLRTILAHESTHILNHDLWWVALARILFIPLWANPLYWLVKRRLRLDQEALADAAAAELTGRQRYAEQLVAWARDAHSQPALHLSSAVGLWEGPSQLRQRIAILLDEQLTVLRNCSRRWRSAAAMLATGAAIGLSLITIQPGHTAPPDRSNPKNASATNPPSTGTLTIRFEYDGTPPAPKELKEGGWRNKLDNRVMRTFNIEKRVGAKVFDESLVVGKDRGIENVLVWVRSRDIPVPLPQELPPVIITYKQGRLSPHVLAFQAPRRLVMRNEGIEACGFNYGDFSLLVQKGKEASFDVKPVRIPMPIASIIEHWRSGSGYVFPLAHPFAAVSDNSGVARIENLPPGTWEFQVWHELPGWLKTPNWRMGRFTLVVKPGENDLGTVKVSPAILKGTAGNSEKPATDTNREQGSTTNGGRTPANSISRPESNTIIGRAVDEKNRPIAGAQAFLFRINRIDTSRKLQAKTSTDADGRYRFENVIDIPKEFPDGKLLPLNPLEEEFVQVYVRAPGRVAGMQMDLRQRIASSGVVFDMTLKPAATLTGRVTGPDGKPVSGALVSVGNFGYTAWDEVASARTKPDGTYVIDDVPAYSMEEYRKKEADQQRSMESFRSNKDYYSVYVAPPVMMVEHPDFAIKRAVYDRIPGTQDVKLEPAAIIEGRVMFGDSSKPAAGAGVHLATSRSSDTLPTLEQSMSLHYADARTNADGKYRFTMLPAGSYDLSAEMPGWVNVGIDAFAAPSGKISTPPNLVLTKGGVISIRLVDDKTGKPIALTPNTRADIAAHQFPLPKGISRPSWVPNAVANSAGRFELHALPGKRAIMVGAVYVGEKLVWTRKTSPGEPKLPVVEVVEGKTVEVDIRVVNGEAKVTATLQLAPAMKIEPPPKPKSAPEHSADKKDGAGTSAPEATKKSAKAKPAAKKRAAGDQEKLVTAPITISGRTFGRDMKPIAGATVYLASLQPGYKRVAQVVSDKQGLYKFENVPLPIQKSDLPHGNTSAEFEVFGTADGYGISWCEPKFFYPQLDHYSNYHNEYIDPKGDGPRMFGNADAIELDLRFVEPAKVRGRVVDEHGKPIAGTVLDIRNADSQWDRPDYRIVKEKDYFDALNERDIVPRNLKTRTVDANGNFEFTGLPVNNRFWIWVHPPGFPTREVWAVTNDTVDTTTKGDTVYKGDDINLVFATPRKVPILVVYGDTGKPAPKVMVSTGGSEGGSGGTTDAEGRINVKLPDGEYQVHIEPRIGTPYLNSVENLVVSATSVKQPARAVLRPAAVADISVVDADTQKPLANVDLWRMEPNADAANGSRQIYGYYTWEVETHISHYDKHRTDKDGKMQVMFEPGRHRIGVGLYAFPDSYEPVEPNGQVVELEAGNPYSIQFQMRKRAQ